MRKDFHLIFVVILSKVLRIFLRNRRDQEILVLRKEIQLLQRKVGRPKLDSQDRLFFIALFKANPKSIANVISIKPSTIIGWHKKLIAKKWNYSDLRKGRPPITDEIKQLIVEMKRENKRWGCRKIQGELKKLRIKVGKTTIWKILKDAGFDPGNKKIERTWFNFLYGHGKRFFACDFIVIETLFLKRLYLFSVMDVANREIIGFAVTCTPNIIWLRNVLTSIFSIVDEFPKFLVTDRDRLFGEWLSELLDGYDMEHLKTPPRTPNCNGYIERWHRTLREEFLDHCFIYGKRDLERLISEYVTYYNKDRPHQGRENTPPTQDAPQNFSKKLPKFTKTRILDGIITNYSLAA